MSNLLKRDTPKKCKECDVTFWVTNKNNKKLFCSIICANKYHNKLKCEVLKNERIRRQKTGE